MLKASYLDHHLRHKPRKSDVPLKSTEALSGG